MSLSGPILDDRTYEQLKSELLRRLPVYTPEWTNHNESDPGIALLELFAYLGESLLYRFNQIPDATKVAFLNLLGAQPRPAQVARVLLSATTDRASGVQVLKRTGARAGAVEFETEDEMYVWPLQALAVGKHPAPLPTGLQGLQKTREERRRRDADLRARGNLPATVPATAPTLYYRVQPVPADPLSNDEPLDVSATVDQSLWVALVRDREFDTASLQGGTLFLGVALDETLPEDFDLVDKPTDPERPWLAETLTVDAPAVNWQLWTAPPGTAEPLATVAVARDSTRGLTTSGVVTLLLPRQLPELSQAPLSSGGRLAPPRLDDSETEAKVVAWLRVHRPQGENDAIHKVRWVGLNAVWASQSSNAQAELLGMGSGDPGQTFRLTKHPVVAGSVELDVEETGGWRRWEEVETLALSQPLDRHYALDLITGEVRFGMRSRAPQLGERIRVVSYRYGGGAAGNVPVGAVSALEVASVTVTNVLPASGGADAATLTEALASVPARVQRRDRAVVREDFSALTLEVPGVGRAEALPLFHPDTPTVRRPGAVSVVVFPEEDLRNPAAPLPDTALLRRVAAYLNPRRLVTTELYVIPPTYRPVAVSVGVHVADGYQVDAVRRWVELLLRQYLAPMPGFGPTGQGWPLGRAVRRSELEAIAVQVDGVDYVVDRLALARRRDVPAGPPQWDELELVELAPWEVPQLSAITVVGGSPLPVGTGYDPAPDPHTDPVVVPLPPEVCG
jgi:predicted phage baseplate assembly protein